MERNKRADFTFKFFSKPFNESLRYLFDMGKKYCFYACKTNYSSEKLKSEKTSVYRFPRGETEKERWIKALRNANLRESKDSVVSAFHWPSCFTEIKVNGNISPPLICPGNHMYHPVKY